MYKQENDTITFIHQMHNQQLQWEKEREREKNQQKLKQNQLQWCRMHNRHTITVVATAAAGLFFISTNASRYLCSQNTAIADDMYLTNETKRTSMYLLHPNVDYTSLLSFFHFILSLFLSPAFRFIRFFCHYSCISIFLFFTLIFIQ